MRRPSIAFWGFLLAMAALALFPYLWIVLTSFKARTDILTTPPVWIHAPNLVNYRSMLFARHFDRYLLNSLEIGVSSTLLALGVGTLAAYAFSRYRVPAGNHLFFYILATRLGPPIAYALPLYFLFSSLGLLKSHIGVIMAHATFNLVLVVWMMKTFFDEIPAEIEEAAILDGCSEWQIFSRVTVPMSLAGLVTAAIFVFIFSWNELLYSMILSAGKANTLPAMIPSLVMNTGTLWGEVAAAAVVQTIPVIVFTFVAQRHLVRGLTFGAVKG
jgi:multiple sugar transport system permease protein